MKMTTSLQKKVAATLCAGIAAFVLVSVVILNTVIAPAFDKLELSAARTDLIRAEQAILNDVENLAAISADWALWDDIYEYMLGRDPAFRDSNLDRPTLTNLGLDILALYTVDQERDWGEVIVNGENRDLSELDILNESNPVFNELTSPGNASEGLVGMVLTSLGPMLISSRPILRSDDSGPSAGTLIMGQFLNEARIKRMHERTEVLMHWHDIEEFGAFHAAADSQVVFSGAVAHVSNEKDISSFKLVRDIFGNDLLVLSSETPRDISALGTQTINVGLLYFGIAALILTAMIWILLRVAILRPIQKLAKHLGKLRKSGDLTDNLGMRREDEIGALANQFDKLTSEVHEARKALLDQSFKAGKADTAAEVLHNIRNAMTPMINGIERLTKSCSAGETLRVAEVTKELADPNCPPDRATKLLQYVDASFQRLSEVMAGAADDLNLVTSQARQIEAIVSDQERFANVLPVAEDIPVNDVLGEATHVIPKGDRPAVEVEVASDLNRFTIHAHRTGLLQVMGNLVLNAYESIQRRNESEGEITFSASEDVLDDKPMIRVTIRDNGAGFNSEVGPRIFERGFSSKVNGKANGLGLHWCANAVSSMGGRIFAESRGAGEGAEFHVLLPAAQGV